MIHKSYNQIAGQKIPRIEAISDGVFAIALTLLVLDIKVPLTESIHSESDLIKSFCNLTPKLLTYFLSFMTLGIFWTGHSLQFNYITRSDRHLNWISLFFLLFVSILPFTTAFLGEHIEFKFAVFIYWANIFSLGLVLFIHWNYANKNNLIDWQGNNRDTINKAINNRIIIAQTLYAIGALLCFVSTYLSIFVIVLVQLNYAFAFFVKIKSGKSK